MAVKLEKLAYKNILTASEIYALYVERRQLLSWRNALYNEYRRYYYPELQQARSGGGVIAMNSYGMPILRAVGESLHQDREYIARRLAPVIDDYQALLGHLPQARSMPADSSPQAEEGALKLTHYIVSTWELSVMDEHHADACLHLPLDGDCCYMLDPYVDPEDSESSLNRRVLISSVDPATAYPGFYSGARRYELYDLLIAERKTPSEIYRTFGIRIGDIRTRDAAILARATHEEPVDQRPRRDGEALERPVLFALPEQLRRPEDVRARDAQRDDVALGLALRAEVEHR